MMSQHSQRTQAGPTGASVATGALLVAVSAVLTGYVTSGPGWDIRKVVATVLGVALTGMLLIRVLGLSAERAVAQDRMAREEERAEREHAEDARYQRMVAERVRHEARVDDELQGWVDQRHAQDHAEPPEEPDPSAGPDYPSEEGPVVYPEPSPAALARWATAGQADAARYVDEGMDPQPPYLARAPMPLPPRQPDGYVDPGPYSSWVPPAAAPYVPVSPGRPGSGWHGDQTEVISRVRDEDDRSAATEVISRVR